MKRILLLLALAAVTAFADTIAASTEEPTELRLWNVPSSFAGSPDWISRRVVFDEFVRRHPEYRVKALVPIKIDANMGSESTEFLSVAGGVAPDVFYLTERKVSDYRTQGFLLSLNKYLSDFEKRTGKKYAGIAAPSSVWELCHSGGNIYTVPYYYAPEVILCHNPTFARNNLAGKRPKNWDELYEFARKMTYDPSKEEKPDPSMPLTYGLMPQYPSAGVGWFYLQMVWAAGGDVVVPYFEKDGKEFEVPVPPVDYRRLGIEVNDEKTYYARVEENKKKLAALGLPAEYSMEAVKWKMHTERPKAMRALDFYRRVIHQPWIRHKGHEFDVTPAMIKQRVAVDPFSGDKFDLTDKKVLNRIYYGVIDMGTSQVGRDVKEKYYGMRFIFLTESGTQDVNADPTEWTIASIPSYEGEALATTIGGHHLGINSTIAAEDKPGRGDADKIREAAWKYIEFMTGPEAQAIKVKVYIDFGVQEQVRPSILKSVGYEDILVRIPKERLEMWEHVDNFGHIIPYPRGFMHVLSREFRNTVDAIANDPIDMVTGEYKKNTTNVMTAMVTRVNDTILGKMPEKEVKRRSVFGWILFALGMAGILGFGAFIVRAMIKAERRRNDEGFGVGGHPGRRRMYAWLFLIPAVATIIIWAYYPLIRGTLMAFQDYKILGGSKYVGMRNFVEVVFQATFWQYLLQTVQYVVLSIGLGFLVPIMLAILLTEIPKGKVLFRTLYYLPAVTTGIVTMFLWKGLLFDTSKQGVINQFMLAFNGWPIGLAVAVKLLICIGFAVIAALCMTQVFNKRNEKLEKSFAGIIGGLIILFIGYLLINTMIREGFGGIFRMFFSAFDFKPQKFLQDPNMAMLWVIVPGIWAHAGAGCLIYLAALKGIPDAQYEAADIDGAGFWKKMVHVTYPNLKALVIINFVGAVVGAMHASQNIFVMTGGGPEDKTTTVGLAIWFNAFLYLDFGMSTAMAWIIGSLLIGFTFNQLRIMNKLQFRSTSVESKTGGGSAGSH
ncbi:MAG: extracellular solute-binding protein [Spirochaetes bacterium]|nr:extracellular solute-binding protein [Spirochaetota bacterium]